MVRPIKQTRRDRHLTPEEVSKYQKVREQIEQEKPKINARILAQLESRQQIEAEFGPFRPVRTLLGNSATDLIENATSFTCHLFRTTKQRGNHRVNIDKYPLLVELQNLTAAQIDVLRRILLDPISYWEGPVFQHRIPPSPEIGFRLKWQCSQLDVLVDLHNPGWEFYSAARHIYWGFTSEGDELVALAQELFPNSHPPIQVQSGARMRSRELLPFDLNSQSNS